MLENNLKYLTTNTKLKIDLESIPLEKALSGISYAKTPNGDTVFLKSDLAMDNIEDPTKYAKSLITDKIKTLGTNDVIFVMGIGVGYILDELFYNTKAKIVVFEPDIFYLRFIFEVIDLSKYLQEKRVFISNSVEDCVSFIIKDYLNDDKIEFVVSDTSALIYSRELMYFSDDLYKKLKLKIVDINTIKQLSKKWVKNIINLTKSERDFYDVSGLENKYKNKSALILGAGPSLKDNIEKIKKNRDDFVIIAVNKTLKTLEANGIIPDYAVFVDADLIGRTFDVSREFIEQTNIIAGYKTENFVINLPCKNLFLYTTDQESFIKKYNDSLNLTIYETAATTTIIAFYSALHMGFEKIYFCGFDLAFKANKMYCDDRTVNIQDGKANISTINHNIVKVKSVTGEMVYTRDDYSVFIKNFEEVLEKLKLNNIYNITDFGAYIKGMKYTSFNDIGINKVKGVKGVNETDYTDLTSIPKIDNKKFIECLNIEKQELLEIKTILSTNPPIQNVLHQIMGKSTFLYEYSQFDIIELTRNIGNAEFAKSFKEKILEYIDEIIAMIEG